MSLKMNLLSEFATPCDTIEKNSYCKIVDQLLLDMLLSVQPITLGIFDLSWNLTAVSKNLSLSGTVKCFNDTLLQRTSLTWSTAFVTVMIHLKLESKRTELLPCQKISENSSIPIYYIYLELVGTTTTSTHHLPDVFKRTMLLH